MNTIEFSRYIGYAYPRNHPTKPDKPLEFPDVQYYAIPGGGVATGAQCSLWGLTNKVSVTFK